ncbi:MAG: right-handed parallel beta-helix repeat-containing protein [Archangium sp.]
MKPHFLVVALVCAASCSAPSMNSDAGTGGGAATGGGGGTTGGGGAATGGGSTTGGGAATGGGVATGGGGATGGGATGGGGSTSAIEIAVWTDAPGACPGGTTQKDITTIAQLQDATRHEGAYASDAPDTCYLIHDGTYVQNGSTLAAFIKTGGTDSTHRRLFVGQSRTGVIIRGRATIDAAASHVRLSNVTFDLTGFAQSGSFNTLSMLTGSTDLRIDHVTFTGDCATGANGGHVEIDGATDVVVEDCLIEKFGRCGPTGHQDHGVYLASGSNLTLRNNDIRLNASRGIQLNTEGGSFGTLDTITIERNRIHDNGHADYEDGIVMNATGTGTISNVNVTHNLIYANYYSGLREVGDQFVSVAVSKNTFVRNGAASSANGRSELNLDDVGSGANTAITRNVIVAVNKVLNDCYDATARSYVLSDAVVQGAVPTGTAGACVSNIVTIDPRFVNASTFDFHTQSPAASLFGAYTP